MLRELLLILSVLVSCLAQNGSPPQSSCPAVFRYSYSPPLGWHGIISIVPPLTFSEVQLVLDLQDSSYGPDSAVGEVDVLGGAAEIQNIATRAIRKQRQTIQFLVIFPPYTEFPRVSSVKFNGYEFCSSPAYNDASGVIELKYILQTGLPVVFSSGNEFSVNWETSTQPQPTLQEPWQPPQQPTDQLWKQPQTPKLRQDFQQPKQPQQPSQQLWKPPQQNQQNQQRPQPQLSPEFQKPSQQIWKPPQQLQQNQQRPQPQLSPQPQQPSQQLYKPRKQRQQPLQYQRPVLQQ